MWERMTAPSSPSPSSGSDDFAALLDAELQTSLEELSEVSREEEEDVDVEQGSDEVDVEDLGPEAEEGREEEEKDDGDGEEEEEEVEGGDNEDEVSKDLDTDSGSQLGEDILVQDQSEGRKGSDGGKRKRDQYEDESKLDAKDVKGECPPHPGFMWGVCIRCGENRQVSNSEPEPVAVALRYIHEGLEVTETEAARMRRDELKHVMFQKKLYLVLDLDHTLLNSARFIEVFPEEEAHLVACYSRDRSSTAAAGPQLGGDPGFKSGLHRLSHLQMWTKLRPFVHEFLEAASKICEMYVYTMGERTYAVAMARLLDPTGRFFGDRVISQGDSTRSTTKDLDVVLGAESAVVILDDTEGVWPKHRANLILMERYHFFRSSCRQFGLRSLSLTEKKRDESETEGTLATALKTLRRVHHTVFSPAALKERGSLKGTSASYQDVRQVIHSMRGRILKGCRVVFSRIFPTGMPDPQAHPFWRLTEELGAHCSNTLNSTTTHVVALDRGTDKARWAKQNERFLVHPAWVEAAQYLWCRPKEENFPVGENNPEPPLSSFSKTADVVEQKRPGTSTNRGSEGSPTKLVEEVDSGTNDVATEVKVSQKKGETEVLDSTKASKHLGSPLQAIAS